MKKLINLEIIFDDLEVDGKKLSLIANGNVKIFDKENKPIFETESIELDRLNNVTS